MTKKRQYEQEGLTADIRRLAGDEPTRRYLRSLPLFQPSYEMPNQFHDMLARMDQAEQSSQGRDR